MTVKRRAWSMVALLVVVAGGCRSSPDDQAATPAPATPPADADPRLRELRNLTYRGLDGALGPIALVDGRWEGEPAAPGGASRPSVQFVDDFHRTGDLDGDAIDEIVVLLGAHGGGSGELVHLAVMARRGSGWQNVATTLVGDRVQLRSGRIEAGRIVLDVVQAGAEDAMCCPGDLVTRTWSLGPTGLEELPSVSTGRLGLATLAGSEWVLCRCAYGEDAPPEPEVTLVVQGEKLAGRSGCNRFNAPISPGAMPGDVIVGPAAATRMACPEPASAVESRFLAQLRGVRKFGFRAGRLALSYEKDAAFGTMLFEARAPQEE